MCMCVVLCAEWLHSSVHGSPGKSPGGGTIPSGEQRQPEYGHWGTVCMRVFVIVWCAFTVCVYIYSSSRVSTCGLYICCTNHLHLLSSSVSFFVLTSLPHSLCICLCLHLFLHVSVLSLLPSFFVSHSHSACPLSFSTPPSHPPSLHEGLGRASLIGSLWWWRQSDLEWVTDEVGSARCLSSTAAAAVTALIYVAEPVDPVHTHAYRSPHVYTLKHVHTQK